MKVERALRERCEFDVPLPTASCACGDWFGIVFGEADPPMPSQPSDSVCESKCGD